MPTDDHYVDSLKAGPTPGLVPVPDPTTLTNQLVEKAVAGAIARLESKVDGLSMLYEEKFTGAAARVTDLNTRLAQGDLYRDTALNAALKAAQNLVDIQNINVRDSLKKTEELFGKQIDALQATVDDLKGAVKLSGGAHMQRADTSQLIFALLAVAGTIGLIIIGAVELLRH